MPLMDPTTTSKILRRALLRKQAADCKSHVGPKYQTFTKSRQSQMAIMARRHLHSTVNLGHQLIDDIDDSTVGYFHGPGSSYC